MNARRTRVSERRQATLGAADGKTVAGPHSIISRRSSLKTRIRLGSDFLSTRYRVHPKKRYSLWLAHKSNTFTTTLENTCS